MSYGRLVVVGQGYVGLPLAIRAAEVGWQVVGFDLDERRLEHLRRGESYIEDVASARVRAAIESGTYVPSSDPDSCRDFDVAVISVPTPLREGNPDLSYVESAAETLGAYLRPGATVVLESTTYPGTTDDLVGPVLGERSGLKPGVDFHLGYSPERIDPGNASWNLVNTPKIVSGVSDSSLDAVDSFFRTIVERTVRVHSTQVAELTKLLENTYRQVNIALVNEIAMFASELDIDVWEAIDAASTKPFGFMRFTPGPGVGGHCLPIDPSYLSWRVRRRLGRSFRFVELANDVNEHMPDYVVRRAIEALNRLGIAVKGSRVLVLGVAYKQNSGDAREAPSGAIIERLVGLGADVRVADPHVSASHLDPRVSLVDAMTEESAGAEARDADLVIVITAHDAFAYNAIVESGTPILDTRHRIDGPTVEYL